MPNKTIQKRGIRSLTNYSAVPPNPIPDKQINHTQQKKKSPNYIPKE